MHNYKVSATTFPGWQSFNKCSLDISISNPNQSGEKLASTVEWINKRFDSCIVNLGDTLYRHNLKNTYSDLQIANNKAKECGDQWLSDNEEILQGFEIPFFISRWDNWLTRPEFKNAHGRMLELFFKSEGFREALESDINGFVCRNTNTEVQRSTCRDYILEELAVYSMMSKNETLVRIYSGERLNAAHYLSMNEKMGLENEGFIKLDFKRRKNIELPYAGQTAIIE